MKYPWKDHACIPLGSGRSDPPYRACINHRKKRIDMLCVRCEKKWPHPHGASMYASYTWGYQACKNDAMTSITSILEPKPTQLSY